MSGNLPIPLWYLVLVHQNVGTLSYFVLTCDIMYNCIPTLSRLCSGTWLSCEEHMTTDCLATSHSNS